MTYGDAKERDHHPTPGLRPVGECSLCDGLVSKARHGMSDTMYLRMTNRTCRMPNCLCSVSVGTDGQAS